VPIEAKKNPHSVLPSGGFPCLKIGRYWTLAVALFGSLAVSELLARVMTDEARSTAVSMASCDGVGSFPMMPA